MRQSWCLLCLQAWCQGMRHLCRLRRRAAGERTQCICKERWPWVMLDAACNLIVELSIELIPDLAFQHVSIEAQCIKDVSGTQHGMQLCKSSLR